MLLVDLMVFYGNYFDYTNFKWIEIKEFYKGTLWLLLVLIHDYSDFLCE